MEYKACLRIGCLNRQKCTRREWHFVRAAFEDEVSHRCGTNASGRHMLPNLMWLATTNTFNAMAAEV